MEPDRLGKYEVRATLGRGAMGTVYAGWDPIISRQVAIKTVRLPDANDRDAQDELARFQREAQAAGRLHHPNIVGVFDYGETAELAFIVMEFVDGQTLKALLDRGERMDVPAIARLMANVLAGLRYSHEHGVIHRDIKPANIIIPANQGHGSVLAKIADFGIARIESSSMTQTGAVMGTPAYMSPEQFLGHTVDARTDLYAAGVLLFQLLTGERPFEGSMASIMHKALNTDPPKPSDLAITAPPGLDAVVARAMARRPDHRFPTAAAFAAAIDAALADPAATPPPETNDADSDATIILAPPRPPTPSPPPPTPAPRKPWPAIAGAIVITLLAGGTWFALSSPQPRPVALSAAGLTQEPTAAPVAPPVAPPPAAAPQPEPNLADPRPPSSPAPDLTQQATAAGAPDQPPAAPPSPKPPSSHHLRTGSRRPPSRPQPNLRRQTLRPHPPLPHHSPPPPSRRTPCAKPSTPPSPAQTARSPAQTSPAPLARCNSAASSAAASPNKICNAPSAKPPPPRPSTGASTSPKAPIAPP